jgi:hypothetical protein
MRVSLLAICPPVVFGSTLPLIATHSGVPFITTIKAFREIKCLVTFPKYSTNFSPLNLMGVEVPSQITPLYLLTSFPVVSSQLGR